MFILHLFFLATLAVVSSFKCPEDPLACLTKGLSPPFFTSIPLTDPNEQATGEHNKRHPEQHPLHHQDGRFSLNDAQSPGCSEEETSDGKNGCKKCSKCPNNGKVLRSCSTVNDTICICERGTYLDILAYECKPCSPCPHGHGVWKKCNRHRDTVCRPCMPGFYSGVLSNELGCSPCDKCTSNQIMLQDCSRIENTVCIDRSIGKRTHFPQISTGGLIIGREDNNSAVVINHQQQSLHEQQERHNNHHQFNNNGNENSHYYDYSTSQASLHIYFAILVVIICCVFFYVLLKWRLHQLAKSAPFKGHVGNIYISKSIRPANVTSLYSPLQQSPNSGFLVNHQSLTSQAKFAQVKQEPPAISDCYRLLTSKSSPHRPVPQQQTSPHLVITWSDNRIEPKFCDGPPNLCYLNIPLRPTSL